MITSDLIIRQAYVRIGAFSGTATEIATAYTGSLANLNTESFPLQSMYDLLTLVEMEMAAAVGLNVNSIYRALLADTIGVTSGDEVPSVGDTTGAPVIGVWGQVRDVVSGIEMTPNLHLDEIRAINNSAIFISSYFSYAFRPPRIYGTQTSMEIDVCAYDQTARQADIEAGGALLFQQCEGAYFAGLMSGLKNEDDKLVGLSNQFVPAYQAWLDNLRGSPRDVVGDAAA